MGNKLLAKELTPDQWRRSNNTMGLCMILVYAIFILVAATRDAFGVPKIVPIIAFISIFVVTVIYTRRHLESRKAMVFMAAMFTLAYFILVSAYPMNAAVLVFPVLLAMTVYLNEKLIMAGSTLSLIIFILKVAIIMAKGGEASEISLGFIGIICVLVCMLGGCKSVHLVITYSNEDAEVIKERNEQQAKTAALVEEIVNDLDSEFHGLVDELTVINYSIGNANTVIDQIADGSETTASAAVRQAEMTHEIQGRLENTSDAANSAKTTADDLMKVVVDGKAQSDELSKQSQLVDESTAQISDTITKLVENVSQVSEITDTILSISSQTNLLALNASIEAARAGEAGKGFAVVADEIRDLAEKTKESTEMITNIVNQLIAVTNETKKGLDVSVESINVQREKVKEVNSSFAAVEEGINTVYGGMDTVNTEVSAVLNANQTIVDGISTLSGISQEISAETATSKDEMNQILSSMTKFSQVMEGTFGKLQSLKETASGGES